MSEYPPNIRVDTLIKYLSYLIKYDTWDKLLKLKNGISPATALKVISYAKKLGILYEKMIRSEKKRPVKVFVIVDGEYPIKLKNFEGTLYSYKKGNKVVIGVYTEVDLKEGSI